MLLHGMKGMHGTSMRRASSPLNPTVIASRSATPRFVR
jgi:hypothetical protein